MTDTGITAAPPLRLRVIGARNLTELIREFRLVSAEDSPLPGFTAGSHVRVQVSLPDGRSDWRHYSLIEFSRLSGAIESPTEYHIAVRREAQGRGGSLFMHERVQVGDTLVVEPPRNEFPLLDVDGPTLLIAGGIGITPMASMAARLRSTARPVRLFYAGRSLKEMAYVPDLRGLLADDLIVHCDDEQGGPLDVDAILEQSGASSHVYVCGPKALLDAVLVKSQARGWSSDRIHFELFSAQMPEVGDQPIELTLARSGRTLVVPADQSILDCLIENGCDPLYDCKRGECGVCGIGVVEGDVDHRDYVLSELERRSNTVIQICVSRAKSHRLILDL